MDGESTDFVRRIIRATAMGGGSIRNVGVSFNATSMDGGSAEFRRKRIRATAMDGGSAEFRRERNQCTAAPLPLLRDNNNSASA